MALDAASQTFINQMIAQLQPAINAGCSAFMQSQPALSSGQAGAAMGGGGIPPTTNGPMYPGTQVPGAGNLCIGGGVSPFSNIVGCPVVCDPCLSAYLEGDLELFAWPLIEAQLYSTFTNLNVVFAGGPFPLAAGTSITLEQSANRTITYLPDCVAITPTWSGGPAQDGLVTYQWAVAQKGATAQVLFGEPLNGSQFKCGDDCEKQPFPEWRGCSTLPIPPLTSLRLIVSLDAAATSVLESVSVIVYHRRSKKKSCCTGCGSGGSCSCSH